MRFPKTALSTLDFYNHKDHLTPKADKSCGYNCLSKTFDNLRTMQNGQKTVKVIPVNKNLVF